MDRTQVGVAAHGGGRPPRVREQAREALAVMTFSAATSAALALVLLLLTHLAGLGGR